MTPTSPSPLAPQSRSSSNVSCCITIPAPRSEPLCALLSKISTSQPIFRSRIPVAKPVREPPTTVARFIQCSVKPCRRRSHIDQRYLESPESRQPATLHAAHLSRVLVHQMRSAELPGRRRRPCAL